LPKYLSNNPANLPVIEKIQLIASFVGTALNGQSLQASRLSQYIVILLCGGNKSTQAGDIETAKRMTKELSI